MNLMDTDDNDHTDIRRLLEEWGLAQYASTFQENKITLSTISMLDHFLVKELITPIGDRAKFLKNLENWKKIANTEDFAPVEPQDDFIDLLNPCHKKVKSVSEFLNVTGSECHLRGAAVTTTNNKQTLTNNTPIIVVSTENQDIDLTNLSCETISNDDENDSVPSSLPLKNLLMQSNEGQGLLNLYLEDGKLSNNGRRKLCNIIIKDLTENDPTKRIDSSILLEKAQEIKEVFKKENISTFFIPYINDSKLKIKRCAKGKLYDCLQNRRRELREAKVITKKNSSAMNTSNNSEEAHESDLSENYDDDIQWLQNSTEPWHTAMEKWQRTTKKRINDLHSSNLSIDEYLNKFPILKTPRGYELLTADFNILYPVSTNKLYENFPLVKQKLFKMALSKCHLPAVKEILEQYQLLKKDNENYEEIESILALMLLPLLLGNPMHKGKKQAWRPSKAEVKDGFITHVSRPMDLQDTIAKRREKYSKLNLTFQPTVVIVGSNYTDIQKYYVVVNHLYFETQTILKTVDTCFKIYHSLNCQYPTESMCVWNFLQIGLYCLRTKWDKHYSTVNAFITDLDIEK